MFPHIFFAKSLEAMLKTHTFAVYYYSSTLRQYKYECRKATKCDWIMIKIENMSFRYAGTHKEVFSGLNLTLQENRIYGMLGKNGVGKRTNIMNDKLINL